MNFGSGSFPVPIRGRHPQTQCLLYLGLVTLPFFLSLSFSFHPFYLLHLHPPTLSPLLLYMPVICPYSCTISSYTGFATGDDAYDVMLGLHHNAELIASFFLFFTHVLVFILLFLSLLCHCLKSLDLHVRLLHVVQ